MPHEIYTDRQDQMLKETGGKVISTPFHDEPLIPVDTSEMIFVFGSNEGGRHGAGAAAYARKYKGAVYGQAWGIQGQSFGLPTMDNSRRLRPLSLRTIRLYVDEFLQFARAHRGLTFQVTRIGCGLGGQKDRDIAPMFIGAPDNCYFDTAWKPYLDNAKFWGTF
jgi:hypothetical protein